MAKKLAYPSRYSIMFTNRIINIMSSRKGDQYKLLRQGNFIDSILGKVAKIEGDLYDKAAVLLQGLIIYHGFISGNKRTGFIATMHFLKKNRGRAEIKNPKETEKIIRNIRRFNTEQLAAWLRKGEMNE